MFSAFKNLFNIDSVKLRFKVLETYPLTVETLNGEIELRCNHAQTITELSVRLIEIYTRGRGNEKRIDEYEMGIWKHTAPIQLRGDSPQAILFKIPFKFVESRMDSLANSNFLMRGLIGLAKNLKGVESEYELIAEATVADAKLRPFAKTRIKFGNVDM
jgi:hypothetical protein